MTDEITVEYMASEMYDEYCEGGFDFDTGMTFDDIFRKIFVDAVTLTVSVYEPDEEESEE